MSTTYRQLVLDMTRFALAREGIVTDVADDGAILFIGPRSDLRLDFVSDSSPIVLTEMSALRSPCTHTFRNAAALLAWLRAWRDAV